LATILKLHQRKNSIIKLLSKPPVRVFILAALLIISCSYSHASMLQDQLNTATNPVDSPATNTSEPEIADLESPLEAKVVYNATDSIRFDIQEQKVYLFGGASIEYQDIFLSADYIEYGFNDNLVSAEGSIDSLGNLVGTPIFKEKESSFEAQSMIYNFKTGKGVIKEVRTQEGDGYLHSEVTKKQPNDHIHLAKGKYTTCSLDHPHYYFNLSKAVVIPDDKIIAGPTYLVIAGVPTPLAVPFGYFPNKKGEAAGILIPTYGDSPDLGFFLLNGGYYWPLGEKLDTRLTGDIYSKGSWGLKNLTRYKNRYKYDGSLDLSYTILKRGVPESSGFSKNTEFFLRWNHRQDAKARPNSKFSANVNAGTSNNFQNNFNVDVNDFLTNTFTSNVSYNKSWSGKPFNFGANLRHNQNTLTHAVNLTLPELTFNMTRIYPGTKIRNWLGLPNVGAKKWYQNIGLTYNTSLKNEINTADTLISLNNMNSLLKNDFRNGMRHNVTANTSFKLFNKKATLNPSINYVERWYLKSLDRYYDNGLDSAIVDTISGFVRGYDYNMATSLSTNLYAFYFLKGGHIIRHAFTPNVSFVYRPSFDSRETGFYGDNGALVSYSPFDIGIYGQPNATESGNVTMNLINNLEMKIKTKRDTTGTGFKKIKVIENFSAATSYDIFKDENNWSTLRLSGRTQIFKNLNLNYNATYDPYDYDTSGTVLDNSQWSAASGLGRFSRTSLTATKSLKSKVAAKGDKKSDLGTARELEQVNANIDGYIDFNIPWSLYLSYNLVALNQINSDGTDTSIITQALNFNGDFNLTEKWKIGFSSGYDFTSKDFTNTSLDIYRDMHCWELSASWIPFGTRQSYSIQLNVKSAMLQDLKLARRRSWYDN
jgi:hypothetical protein